MRTWVILTCLFFVACGAEPRQATVATETKDSLAQTVAPVTSATITHTEANTGEKDTATDVPPLPRPVKKPSGIYRVLLPFDDGKKMIQTVAFYPGSYRLQEEYPDKKDSIVLTEGTWSPSQGYIWLYKDQIVRGRYTWKGDTLQYFSPRLRQHFPMEKLTPATANEAWQTKMREGTLLYGVGNEPFWSVEVTDKDSIRLNMPEWTAPLQVKLSATNVTRDSTVYVAESDSLLVTVYPLFCNDGMSDFLYTKRLKLNFRGQTLEGCGEVLRQGH